MCRRGVCPLHPTPPCGARNAQSNQARFEKVRESRHGLLDCRLWSFRSSGCPLPRLPIWEPATSQQPSPRQSRALGKRPKSATPAGRPGREPRPPPDRPGRAQDGQQPAGRSALSEDGRTLKSHRKVQREGRFSAGPTCQSADLVLPTRGGLLHPQSLSGAFERAATAAKGAEQSSDPEMQGGLTGQLTHARGDRLTRDRSAIPPFCQSRRVPDTPSLDGPAEN
jgi:hypothetical protein